MAHPLNLPALAAELDALRDKVDVFDFYNANWDAAIGEIETLRDHLRVCEEQNDAMGDINEKDVENGHLRATVTRLEAERDAWEIDRRQRGDILSKTNEALNRAGCYSAMYYWEHIDAIAAARDTALALAEVRGQEVARLQGVKDRYAEVSAQRNALMKSISEAREAHGDPISKAVFDAVWEVAETNTADAIASWLVAEHDHEDGGWARLYAEQIRAGKWRKETP